MRMRVLLGWVWWLSLATTTALTGWTWNERGWRVWWTWPYWWVLVGGTLGIGYVLLSRWLGWIYWGCPLMDKRFGFEAGCGQFKVYLYWWGGGVIF